MSLVVVLTILIMWRGSLASCHSPITCCVTVCLFPSNTHLGSRQHLLYTHRFVFPSHLHLPYILTSISASFPLSSPSIYSTSTSSSTPTPSHSILAHCGLQFPSPPSLFILTHNFLLFPSPSQVPFLFATIPSL